MEKTKEYLIRNIAPPLGVLFVCIFGAFLVYKSFYSGEDAQALARISPAAGKAAIIRENGNTYIPINYENIPIWPGPDKGRH